jgi:predicted HicB family RNase H-like nuclease
VARHLGQGRGSKRKGGGGKLSRSEVVTVRLDPRLRYTAELVARKERRTVSSFIESAVEQAVNKVFTKTAIDKVWDTDETVRFIKLATQSPELLNHQEQVLWRQIKRMPECWKGSKPDCERIRKILSSPSHDIKFSLTEEEYELFALLAKKRRISLDRLMQRMINKMLKDTAAALHPETTEKS